MYRLRDARCPRGCGPHACPLHAPRLPDALCGACGASTADGRAGGGTRHHAAAARASRVCCCAGALLCAVLALEPNSTRRSRTHHGRARLRCVRPSARSASVPDRYALQGATQLRCSGAAGRYAPGALRATLLRGGGDLTGAARPAAPQALTCKRDAGAHLPLRIPVAALPRRTHSRRRRCA
jgi:hypothetical protein